MPRLKDLLEYLATPGLEDIWVLFDIKLPLPTFMEALWGNREEQVKRDEYTDDLFRVIAATLADVKTSRPWNQRVLIGCWAVSFLCPSLCFQSLMLLTIIGKIPSPLHKIPTRVFSNSYRI